MDAFLISTGIVALAEMGDKTQLLALILAARFRKPVPIILGILIATLLNHAGAGAVGHWVTAWLGGEWLRWVLGISFLAMAIWIMIPDKIDDEDTKVSCCYGVFGTTLLAFFLAEMGDKTQIATVALAANYNNLLAVHWYYPRHADCQCSGGAAWRQGGYQGTDESGSWHRRPAVCHSGHIDVG